MSAAYMVELMSLCFLCLQNGYRNQILFSLQNAVDGVACPYIGRPGQGGAVGRVVLGPVDFFRATVQRLINKCCLGEALPAFLGQEPNNNEGEQPNPEDPEMPAIVASPLQVVIFMPEPARSPPLCKPCSPRPCLCSLLLMSPRLRQPTSCHCQVTFRLFSCGWLAGSGRHPRKNSDHLLIGKLLHASICGVVTCCSIIP